MKTAPRVLVLGVGNILWADEGFGVRCVEAFAARHVVPETVTLLDGGTQGLLLIDFLRDHDHVLILDAVDFGGAPAQLSIVRDDAVPAFVGARAMSLHQTSMMDVIALAGLLGWAPTALTLIGVQPVVLEDYGGSLTPAVRARMEPALAAAEAELRSWGVALRPRQAGNDAEGLVMDRSLALAAYEAGRPSADRACRIGDERVLVHAQRE
jgi:hydrogenase maturation protease